VRAATPDGLPLAGPSRSDPSIILAVGARRNGWLLAPLVAGMVLDAVEGRAGPHAALFDPARFTPC
jgi:glycine oxidase